MTSVNLYDLALFCFVVVVVVVVTRCLSYCRINGSIDVSLDYRVHLYTTKKKD